MGIDEYILDCEMMTDRETAHDYIAETLLFPGHYGRNLDALFDCLTEMGDCCICLQHTEALNNLGSYGAGILETFRDAAKESGILLEEDQD